MLRNNSGLFAMQLINDLSVKLKRYENEINNSINRVIQSGWLVLGPEVDRFEMLFSEYHDVQHCVGVANGTDALELALRAIGVGSGSIVATVANAGAYTTTALNCIGAKPLYMEVDERFQCVTLEAVDAALKSDVDAIVVTHLFGRVVPEITQIAKLCQRYGVPLLEDCAQAHGASLAGKRVGSFGAMASFSFYPTKNLGALGDGGAVITNNEVYADAIRQLRQYGWSSKYQIGLQNGRNSRLDEIQAALLADFLPYLDTWNEERLRVACRYDVEISNPLISKPPLTLTGGGKPYVAHLYVVQTSLRDQLRAHLKALGILSDVHYPIPDHMQAIGHKAYEQVSLPITESLAQSILTLPCYLGMSDDQINHVVEAVNSWGT